MFDSFCQMNKITSKEIKVALDRPFKKKEIIEVIEQLPSYCKEGNFIKKQGFLSKMPLSSMFYNEYGSFVSMFALAAIKGGAKPISESFEIKCQYPNIAERLKKIDINYDKMTVPDKKQFNKIFSDMDARLKSIPRTSCEHPGIADFITAYYRLMEYFNMQNTLFAFSPYSWQYKKICSYDARPFNQIRQWMLEKKDEDEYERQKEYVRNHGITDDEYCED